jgi:hypothetical protein
MRFGFRAMPSKLSIRLRGRQPTDLWQFGLDVREVMLTRIGHAIAGTLSAAEARRMILEKVSAGARAQLVYAQKLRDGSPSAAGRAAFEVYRREVQSNRKRLGTGRRKRG